MNIGETEKNSLSEGLSGSGRLGSILSWTKRSKSIKNGLISPTGPSSILTNRFNPNSAANLSGL